MMDLLKLDIAIAEASEFLKLARDARPSLLSYVVRCNHGDSPNYPIDECAKVRAKSLVLYRALVDLRRKEGDRNVSLRETPC